jgi:tetratricopeptide (TPR) repeat protein
MDEHTIELRVLGAVRLLVDGVAVRLEPRLHAVLGIAAAAGGKVSHDELASRFRTTSRDTLRSYGAKLRARAGVEVVKKNVRSALELALGPEEVDLWRFHRVMVKAKGLPAHEKLPLLVEAAALWGDQPLANVDSKWLRGETDHLRAAGRRAFLELIRLCAEHEGPERAVDYAERANQLFMDDDEIRSELWRLWSQTGQMPMIWEEILRREAAGEKSSSLAALRSEAESLADEARHVLRMGLPYQLPPVRAELRDRDADLAVLEALTTPGSGVRVVTICGLGGIGKTELAVTWAHRAAALFPDGVLYIDMRGFSPSSSAEPSVVLRGFAKRLGVTSTVDDDDLLAVYRTVVNTRAVLVVIDNARDHLHTADLVAAGEHSRTIVTTRAVVTTPIVLDARVLHLDPISLDGSLAVLSQLAGHARVKAEPFAARELMKACGGLPLAVRLVASQASLNSGSTMAKLVTRLGSAAALLGMKPEGETALRDSLSLSYAPLSAEATWVLQVVAIHPGRTVSTDVVVFLSGLPEGVVDDAVDELLRGNLLDPLPGDRFSLHDLVRAFALERAAEERPEQDVAGVRRRLLGWLLAAARQCDRALRSGRELPDDLAVDEGTPLPDPVDDIAGTRWFEREHNTLVEVLTSEEFQPFEAYRWRLALAMCCYLTRNGPWLVAERLLESACEIDKSELADRDRLRYQAVCHRVLGNIQRRLHKFGAAERNLATSITLAERVGETLDVANGHQQMGVLHEDREQWVTARHHATTAGQLYAGLADERGVAATLVTEIHCHFELGEPERALSREELAVAVMERASTPYNQGALHRVLMRCHMEMDRHAEAVAHGEAARACYAESGAPINEARVLGSLAQAYREVGRVEDEREALLSCVAIYEQVPPEHADDKLILRTAQSRIKEVAKGGV